eukprot:CAMPEP_0183375228 /NCGR_PEP_ID=MMETSP0164_2-20130417/116736_1 /TAXON_ID=221442 /ORGANISM="Coccolithus pelagicus ssp braarudi, Strain PLY182g" /LENGTH=46 /DNA_ID= /DNA_START= /DNA_END= /DNA_ORIENTATION=
MRFDATSPKESTLTHLGLASWALVPDHVEPNKTALFSNVWISTAST